MQTPAASAELVGTTAIAADFYAGRYHDVLAATIDSRRGGCEPVDAGFVVGALASVGRLDEAELLLDNYRRAAPTPLAPRILAAGGFFLCVALCRAGQLARAATVLARAARDTRGRRDAWVYSLLHQGAACGRYFRAQYAPAARAAARALASAQQARFAYGQMLANDLRGHLLVQTGRFRDGLAVLARAREQALGLELGANAHAIEISIALTRARLGRPAAARAALTELLAREGTHDSYSRRAVLLDLAILLAWAGEASAAAALLEQQAAPLCGEDDRRAQVALGTARAQLARVQRGWPAARALAARAARELAAPQADLAREVEVAGVLYGAAHASGEPAARAEARAWLERLAAGPGLYRARVWLAVFSGGGEAALQPADMDEMTGVLAAIARGSADAALEAGLYGLFPEALGRAPGRRIHAFEHATIIEDHGDVAPRPALSHRARALLAAVAGGEGPPRDREQILRAVWGLKGYRPERHDSLIKTTVSRLRAALGEQGRWVLTASNAYRLAPEVEFVDHTRGGAAAGRAARGDDDDDGRGAHDRDVVTLRYPPRWRALAAALARAGEASVSELARHVRASVRTTSRDLSAMHAQRIVGRAGAGRGTRYYTQPLSRDE